MINKINLINLVEDKTNYSKEEVEEIADALFDTILEKLSSGEEVKIAGFGKFEVKQRVSRKVLNPSTKEEMVLPSQKAITYRASKQAKDLINK